METEHIDKLFLELSQFTKATTKREAALTARLAAAEAWNEYVRTQHKCQWAYDETREVYITSCDHAWMFIDDGIVENGVKYCPFCGGFINEVLKEGRE